MTITPTTAASHRFHLLDGLRGVAAIMVALWHAPLYFKTYLALHSSYLAVDFFCCLSGFILAFTYEARIHNGLGLRNFLLIRLIRLYPVYAFATLLPILFGLLRFGTSYIRFIAHAQLGLYAVSLAMLPPVRLADSQYLFPLDPPAWSLFYELLVNIAFACLLVTRLGATRSIALIALLTSMGLAILVLRGHTLNMGSIATRTEFTIGILRTWLDFMMGVLVLRFIRRSPQPRTHSWLFPALLTLGLVFLLVGPIPAMTTPAFHLLALIVLFPGMVYLGARLTTPRSWQWLCSALGDLSYPLYLLHWMTLFFAVTLLTPSALTAAQPFRSALLALLIGLLSIASWLAAHFFDQPLRRLLSSKLRRPALSRPTPFQQSS